MNPSAFTDKQLAATLFKPALSKAVVKERPGDARRVAGKDTSRHPVETVSWDDATQFCQKLSALPAETGARRTYRLPSETEWEYACRVGSTTRWSCGDETARLVEHGWVSENAGSMTHPVGEKKGNSSGLYDMHGNVWEWCLDWHSRDYYGKSPAADPMGPSGGLFRVSRGGSWIFATQSARSAFRSGRGPGYRNHGLGLRACLVLAE